MHNTVILGKTMSNQDVLAVRERATSSSDLYEVENEESKGSVRVVSGSGFRYVVPFPWRLHQMLQEIDEAGSAHVVSWLHDGQHFQVHHPHLFVMNVIPKFFKQKSYKSFQRQLHLYGFHRETDGPYRGAYYHESFVRNNRQLSLEISRIKAPKRRRPAQELKQCMTFETEVKESKKPVTSVIDRFQSLHDNLKQKSCTPLNRNIDMAAPSKSDFDPVATFQLYCSCTHRQKGPHRCLSMSKPESPIPVSDSSSFSSDSCVSDTYNWLINTGVPVSDFDPVALHASSTCPSDIYDCADEIRSLFARPTNPLPSPTHVSTGLGPLESLFGITEDDASLGRPARRDEISSSIWGFF